MNKEIQKLNESVSAKLKNIYEFKVFSQLAYTYFRKSVDNGYTCKATIPNISENIDQDTLKENLSYYESKYLIELSFQHFVSVFESWFFDVLRILLQNPDFIVCSNWEITSYLYYKKEGKYYKVVVVDMVQRRIRTAYTADKVKIGEIKWKKGL